MISQPHEPGPESCLRLVLLWQTVERTFRRPTGLPWRCNDWAYWLENVWPKSCSTRPRVVSGVQPTSRSAIPAAVTTAASRLMSASGDVAAAEGHEADAGRDDQVHGADGQPAHQRSGVRRAVEQAPPGRHGEAEQHVPDRVPRVEERVQLHAQAEDDRHDDPEDAAAREDRDEDRDGGEAERRGQHRQPAGRDEPERRGRRAQRAADVDERVVAHGYDARRRRAHGYG